MENWLTQRTIVARWFVAVVLVGLMLAGTANGQSGFKLNEPKRSTAGYFLVATPELDRSRFSRTVILMLEHDSAGAMGLVVNRPIGRTRVAELLRTMGLDPDGVAGDLAIYSGGPVESERGFVLHSSDYKGKGTVAISRSLAITTRSEIIRELAAGRGPRESLVIFGYSGWGPGQLEDEMASGAWFTIPLDGALLFDKDQDRKWEKAVDRRGVQL